MWSHREVEADVKTLVSVGADLGENGQRGFLTNKKKF